MTRRGLCSLLVTNALFAASCGSNPELATTDEGPGTGNSGGAASAGGRTGTGGGIMIGEAGSSGAAGDSGEGGAPGTGCEGVRCRVGQRCEEINGQPECVDTTCAELLCSATEECAPAVGSGFQCKDVSCDSDVDCAEARHCKDSLCVDDVCVPDTRTCDGAELRVCGSNGASDEPAYSCNGAGYYDSVCSDKAGSLAISTGCTCEGDWDCPEFTACEAGVCKGTGVEPKCTLPPTPFEDVLPQLEFRWGGTNAAQPAATGKAFSWSAQVAATPVVINLDDDNGDGLVNELDFPELLFTSYHSAPEQDGIVRAIHAGGPNKGADYFALCALEHWFEGEPVATDCNRSNPGDSRGEALARGSGALAAGDLNGDGLPEIVVPLETGAVQILNNRGELITTSAAGLWPSVQGNGDWRYPAPAIANLDYAGLAEIVVGNRVLTLSLDANGRIAVDRVFTGAFNDGTMHNGSDEGHHGPAVCLADLVSAPGLEIVAGTSLYRLPSVANCTQQPTSDYCQGRLTSVWNARTANPGSTFYENGFCAVADVLGATTNAAPGPSNPLDGVPEVLVAADGHLVILAAANGALLRDLNLGGGTQGGAPNIDDFDGDGFPEIATALSDFYSVVDLQAPEATFCPTWPALLLQSQLPPGTNPARDPGGACTRDDQCNTGAVCNAKAGQCVCLHSGWKRDTEDDSSKVTSSSVFDFNGDGAAEVVYNDECYFRVYDGGSGSTYLQLPSLSRTILENPVVADVDNDGNSEIVFVQNNETIQCGDVDDATGNRTRLNSWPSGVDNVPVTSLPNGIEVWGDPSDVWVAARRVWNQHAYHVTNVTEGGQIPTHEPESWKTLNGRLYNTYRSQPRNYGVAPDLVPIAIQVSSPDVACGVLSDVIDVSVLVKNEGDLRVGPGVQIAFSGGWDRPAARAVLEDANGDPITVTLTKSLEPGASTIVTISYQAGSNGRDDLPVEITASVDAESTQRECHEDNNEIIGAIDAGAELADLRLVIDSAAGCTPPRVEASLYNDGSTAASDIVVRIYAGDPSQGGQAIGEVTVAGPLLPGESEALSITLEHLERDVTLYGVADPLNVIAECNDANNFTTGPTLYCYPIAR